MNKADYPPNWKKISEFIRFERAKGQCECMGECGINHNGRCQEMHGEPPINFSARRVMLTTAHLDHNSHSDDPDNLRAMCQRCHLRYDLDQHQQNARRTRARKARQALLDEGQLIFDI